MSNSPTRDRRTIVPYYLRHRQQQADAQYDAAKDYTGHRSKCLPAPDAQLDVAERWQDVSQSACARGADELKDGSQVAGKQRQAHSRNDERGAEDEVALRVEGFIGEVVVRHHLSADEGLEWQSRQHVESKAEPSDVDHDVVGREVVEHIALRFVAKGEVAGQGHDQARYHGNACRIMRDDGEAVQSWLLKGAVDEQAVVMTNKSEGYDTDSLEHPVVNKKRAPELASKIGGYPSALGNNSNYDYEHTEQS